jgi:hypothetical protein
MVFTLETVLCGVIAVLDERSSRDAELQVFGKLPNEKLQVIAVERKISIQIPDDLKIKRLDTFKSCIEGVNLAGKAPVEKLGAPDQFDPRIPLRV